MTGYIKIPRLFFDHWTWDKSCSATKVEAFLDLIQLAAFVPAERLVGDSLIELQVGDIVASERFLENRWKWSRTKVRKYLKNLETTHDITRRKDHGQTIITLDSIWVAALWETQKEPPKKHRKDQKEYTEKTKKDTSINTSKEPNISNSKEFKGIQRNESKESELLDHFPDSRQRSISPPSSAAPPSLPGFDQFWNSYPRKLGKQAAVKAFKTASKKIDLSSMLTALEKHKQSESWQKNNGQFIPHASTWLNGERWADELEITNQAQSGPSWLPANWRDIATQISGRDCSNLREWTQISPDYRPDFEQACKKKAA